MITSIYYGKCLIFRREDTVSIFPFDDRVPPKLMREFGLHGIHAFKSWTIACDGEWRKLDETIGE